MFANRENELREIVNNFSYEKFGDVSDLIKKGDDFAKTIVVSVVKKMFCNYSLINNNVAFIVANLIADCCCMYEEESVKIVSDCLVEKIGERTYAVGVNTFISRMEKIMKGGGENGEAL